MFVAQPRAKRNALPPPPKRRRTAHAIEEISFDNEARADYLTGFHKRKVQRQKRAQEAAAERARQERIAMRKEVREKRQEAIEEHVRQVNELLKVAQRAGQDDDGDGAGSDEDEDDEWAGFEDDAPQLEPVDHEEEYVDEDRYTTVTVESVTVDKEGMHKPGDSEEEEDDGAEEQKDKQEAAPEAAKDGPSKERKQWPKKKKKKFRYENKIERQLNRKKQQKPRIRN